MKAPYVRLLKKVGKINVFEVDGMYVRSNLSEEFTNFGQHYKFDFIPENEFWLDRENSQQETQFFIDHLLVEHRLMARGVSYVEAIVKADRVEQRERNKPKLVKVLRRRPHSEETIDKIHIRVLKKLSGGVKVWLVRGDLVRDLFNIDFTEGGHDKVYHFVPDGEVWIDDDLNPRERIFVLIHELHERFLMAQGSAYDPAHFPSSDLEYACRHGVKDAKRVLAEEIEKNGGLVGVKVKVAVR